MLRISICDSEAAAVQRVVRDAAAAYGAAEAPEFLRCAPVIAHDLPRGLRQAFMDFKIAERAPAILVSGYPIDGGRIGRTPAHWRDERPRSNAVEEEMLLVLCASLLGDAFGWATQQAGRIVHDVLPIKGHEHEQIGTGSEELIWWHTEDAFHPYAGDYVGLLCLRNPTGTATTLGMLEGERLSAGDTALLAQAQFVIRPDESHQPKNQASGSSNGGSHNGGSHVPAERSDGEDALYREIEAMNAAPPRVPVLYGRPGDYYLKLDPYFMDRTALPPEADAALTHLIDAIDASLVDVVLQPGDILFVDNCKAVHGRKPFTATHDGNDRWLKRINVTRDLRKSRAGRSAPDSRIIG